MNKYKIIIDRGSPSKEEVQKGKDFQALLGKYKKVTKPFYKKMWPQISGVVIIISILTVVISNQKKSKQKSSEVNLTTRSVNKINVHKDDVSITNFEEVKVSMEGEVKKTSINAKDNSSIVNSENPIVRKEEISSIEKAIPEPIIEIVVEEKRLLPYQKDSITSLISKFKAQAPLKPRKAREKSFKFNLDVLPNEFPELANYKDVIFEIGLENENVPVNIDKIDWERGDLKVNEKGFNYILTLQNGKDIHKFIVYPVLEGKSYDAAFKEYELYQKKIEDLQNILKESK